MRRGRGRRGAVAGLVTGVVASLSACALSVPGLPVTGGGSAFDEALAAGGHAEEGPGGRFSFAFSDVDGIQEALGADTLEEMPSETHLMTVGLPRFVTMPPMGQSTVPLEDYVSKTEWSVAHGVNGMAVSRGPELFDLLAGHLGGAGWSRQGDALTAGRGPQRQITGVVVGRDEGIAAGRTRDDVDALGTTDLGDDEQVAALRDCLGDAPLVVSLTVVDTPQNGFRAYALSTTSDDGELVTRGCMLADDPESAAAKLPDRTTITEAKYDVADVEVDGEVVSARLVPKGDGPAAEVPHVTAHLSMPESMAPGF